MTMNLTDEELFRHNEILSVSITQDKFKRSMCIIAFQLQWRSENVHLFLFFSFFFPRVISTALTLPARPADILLLTK